MKEKRIRRKLQKSLVLMVFLLSVLAFTAILLPINSYAWWSWTYSTDIQSTHDWISNQAFEKVRNRLINPFLKDNANYVSPNNRGYLWYTYTPDNDEGAHCGDGSRNGGPIDYYFIMFKNNYNLYLQNQNNTNAKEEALKYLGYCLHLIADMSVPSHAFNIKHEFKPHNLFTLDNFEHASDDYQRDFFNPNRHEIYISSENLSSNPPDIYRISRQETLVYMKNIANYWLEGTSGSQWCGDNYSQTACSSLICDDGLKGKYPNNSLGIPDDKFPSDFGDANESEQALVIRQLNEAIKNTGRFLLSLDWHLTPRVSSFKLPDSDQRKCYQGVSPWAEIPCAGTGQDGAYIINPLSYTDNGNATVTDNNTGLMWQRCSVGQNNDSSCSGSPQSYNWYQASGTYQSLYNPTSVNVCGSLTLGGHSDWRLPSKKELITIVDYNIPYPVPVINTTYFPNTLASYCWSSATSAGFPDDAWGVYFDYGGFYYYYKGYYYYVRCVRAGK